MTTGALAGYGVLLKVGDGGSPETFTTIAEVRDIEGPELEAEAKEVTSHDSPGGWREYITTLLSGGEVSFDLNFIPTHATLSPSTGLVKLLRSRTLRNFRLVFPDVAATAWTFAALVVGFKPSGPVEDELSAEVTLQVSGEPTLE